MNKLKYGALMLLCSAFCVHETNAQVVKVYTNDGKAIGMDDVEKVVFHNASESESNLYQELKKRGDYTITLRLIDDLKYTEKLSGNGVYTLFAANDDAYAAFFKNNPWGVTSYAQLTKIQKAKLLKMSMLGDAYLLESLRSEENGKDKNCLRRPALATATDFVAPFAPQSLPKLSANETDWFQSLREKTDDVYMTSVEGAPMVNQFYEDVLKKQDIPLEDIELILGKSWDGKEETLGFMNDCRIVEADIACSNGYLHILDKVLFPAETIAESLRTNGETHYFSLLLERLAIPYFNQELTDQYNLHYSELRHVVADNYFDPNFLVDSVYEKYYSYQSMEPVFAEKSLNNIPVMFVPNDEVMKEFFLRGSGSIFIEQNCNLENTEENLEQNLLQLPSSLVEKLLKNFLNHTFANTIPSNFNSIYDKDISQMFGGYSGAKDYYNNAIQQSILANDGLVYVTKVWPTMPTFSSVMMPVLFSPDSKIVSAVATADDRFTEGTLYNSAPLKKYYSFYLKTMQTKFSFFVPTDEALGTYGLIDPTNYAQYPYGNSVQNRDRYWTFQYRMATNAIIPIYSEAYIYNRETGQQPGVDRKQSYGGTTANVSVPTSYLTNGAGKKKATLLCEMMDQHTIVHEANETLDGTKKYFMSRSGAPVYINNAFSEKPGVLSEGSTIKGGFQLMLDQDNYYENDHEATVIKTYDMNASASIAGNGQTYFIDRPIQSTMRSVYNVMTVQDNDNAEKPFESFYDLMAPECVSEELLEAIGLLDDESYVNDRDRINQLSKYFIFVKEGYNVPAENPARDEALVRLFNNFNYTIYVPSNEQVQAARDNGLMTWNDIYYWVSERTQNYTVPLSSLDSLKAQTMVTTLMNFVRYHFQDLSVFCDGVTAEGKYTTSCYDYESSMFLQLDVKQSPSKITITDAMGREVNVVNEEGKCNVLAREMGFDKNYAASIYVKNSSNVVIHQIDQYLNFNSKEDYEAYPSCPVGRFDIWNYIGEDQKKAKALKQYVTKYKIRQ